MTGALGEVGWVAELLVNQTTGHVVRGHLRLELALARGGLAVPVTYVELSEDEERLVLASLVFPAPPLPVLDKVVHRAEVLGDVVLEPDRN